MNRKKAYPIRIVSSPAWVHLLVVMILGSATQVHAIAGKGAKLEFAIDAPWRLEPVTDGSGKVTYGAIPIQISIHDALVSALDEQIQFPNWVSSHHVGRFIDLTITQVNTRPGSSAIAFPSQRFTLLDLDRIERTTGVWQFDLDDPCLDPPVTQICRVAKDPACAAEAQWVEGTSEWHAMMFYRPLGTLDPGTTVRLQATVRLSRERATLAPAQFGQLARYVELHDLRDEPDYSEDSSGLLNFVNEVAIHLGDEPLPRFGKDWLYGDLHYHSQGTDNEGESAHDYRGVLDAMGAIGIDFVFATEHASDSPQFVDGDTSIGIPPVSETACGLRDMSPGRFASLHGALHGTLESSDGANRMVMNRPDGSQPQTYRTHGGVPQIFLGGEVDVIPEIGAEELISPRPEDIVRVNNMIMAEGHAFAFGDGLRFQMSHLCDGSIVQAPGGLCFKDRVLEAFGDTYLIKDLQGFNDWYHSRQHILYLPGRQDTPSAFVSSRTEKYGGGGRLLFRSHDGRSPVVPEIESKGGYFFIAHPLDSAGKGSEGPGMVPYSERQLRELLKSPAFLGLQLWNEDSRLYSEAMDGPPPMSNRDYVLGKTEAITEPDGKDGFAWDDGLFTLSTNDSGTWNPAWSESRESGFEGKLYHAAYTWDRMLLWGLGAKLWFTRGCEPRKILVAGGSDAHGDFNYRREGYFHGTDGIVDTAIAKPRNLVHADRANGKVIPIEFQPGAQAAGAGGIVQPAGYVPHSQEQIIDALRSGEFCVTDGPALRISIGETPMGGVHYLEGTRFSITVEWKSTAEFGQLEEIHLYVGAGSSESCSWNDRNCPEVGLVYTPRDAGPRNDGDELYPTPGPFSSGPPFTIYRTNERLRIHAGSEGHALGYSGTASVLVGNGDFPMANGERPDRYFVRAVGRTTRGTCGERAASESCLRRFAFTNPIWVIPGDLAAPPQQLFQRGDSNGDGNFDVSDAMNTLAYLFLGTATLGCQKAADSNADGRVAISDATHTLGYLFLGSAPPPAPFPDCGPDPSVSRGSLTCQAAPRCGAGEEQVPSEACLPDLVISGFEKLGPLEIGLRAFIQPMGVTVTNLGGRASGPCKIRFSPGTMDLDVGPLDPGASKGTRVELRFDDTYLGRVVSLTARADSGADVVESDESNNRSAPVQVDFPDHCELDGDVGDPDAVRFCWDDPPAKPDLVALEVRVTGRIALPAGGFYSVPMEVTLKNAGGGDAGAFKVALRIQSTFPIKNEPVVIPWSVPELAAGATKTFAATAKFPADDFRSLERKIYALADPTSAGAPSGSVIEDDESNNSTPAITIRFP